MLKARRGSDGWTFYHQSHPGHANGQVLNEDEVLAAPPGSEFCLVCMPLHGWTTIFIPSSLLFPSAPDLEFASSARGATAQAAAARDDIELGDCFARAVQTRRPSPRSPSDWASGISGGSPVRIGMLFGERPSDPLRKPVRGSIGVRQRPGAQGSNPGALPHFWGIAGVSRSTVNRHFIFVTSPGFQVFVSAGSVGP